MTTEPTGAIDMHNYAHLPECQCTAVGVPSCICDDDEECGPQCRHNCICDRLRACEARVREVCESSDDYMLGIAVGMHNGWLEGHAAALDAARGAVAALLGKTVPPSDGVTEALAAIDALQTSLSGPAAVRTSEPEPPTSVAPAGEDHGAHVKPIYVDAWDGMAVPYDDHVVAVEAAHAAGMREALADFLTSIDEDDPVYLHGHARGIQDGMRIGRAMAACDIEQLGVWAVNPNSYIRLTDGTRLVRLNDAVKAARGGIDA